MGIDRYLSQAITKYVYFMPNMDFICVLYIA